MLNGISQRSKKGLKRDKPEQSGTVTEPERTEPARGRGHSENIKSKAWHRAGEVSIRKLPSEALRGVQVMAEAGGVAQGGADGAKVGCGPRLPERLLSTRVGAFRMGCRRLLAGAGEVAI